MTFNVASTLIFALAITHTFLTPYIYTLSQKLAQKKEEKPYHYKSYHFWSEIFYLLSEVEVVFGIWLIPLIGAFTFFRGWGATVEYLKTRDYTHALYITVITVVIASRPIITFAERFIESIARIWRDTPAAWWWTILTIAPLLGSFLKEPAAMALGAILLSKKFYPYAVRPAFKYATLGLLFTNVSVGGMLTTFSSRALFIVADAWDWDWKYMLTHFSWKVLLGMGISNAIYFFIFRNEFRRDFPKSIPALEKDEKERPTPLWITLVHLFFLTLIILTSQSAPLFVGLFILFLGFWRATSFYQSPLHLQSAILIGFFFAGLIIHGELQGWWIVPIIENLDHAGALLASYGLSAFTDNAIVGYLTVDVPAIHEMKHYFIISGAMAAGGLTLIANAPNPIGHAILRPAFSERISLFKLFLAALSPSLIYLLLFWIFSR